MLCCVLVVFVCVPVSCVSSVSDVSGLSILNYTFGFPLCVFTFRRLLYVIDTVEIWLLDVKRQPISQ